MACGIYVDHVSQYVTSVGSEIETSPVGGTLDCQLWGHATFFPLPLRSVTYVPFSTLQSHDSCRNAVHSFSYNRQLYYASSFCESLWNETEAGPSGSPLKEQRCRSLSYFFLHPSKKEESQPLFVLSSDTGKEKLLCVTSLHEDDLSLVLVWSTVTS